MAVECDMVVARSVVRLLCDDMNMSFNQSWAILNMTEWDVDLFHTVPNPYVSPKKLPQVSSFHLQIWIEHVSSSPRPRLNWENL